MNKPSLRGCLLGILVCCLSVMISFTFPTSAIAVNNPELLPDTVTPIVDLANFLPQPQEDALIQDINTFEAETGWKLRILTQYDRSPGRAVIKFWGLDDKSILLVADARGGNILAFSIGDAVYELMPRTFWIELQARFGNIYYVRENGENRAITQALETVKGCLVKENGCLVVPGLPNEQWIFTLITSMLLSPLWGILVISFGIGPVVTRTSDWLPLLRNVMGFAIGALVAYLSPLINQNSFSKS